MLEVSPQFAATKPEIQVHPLGIGGKSDPARLVFEGIAAPEAIAVSMVDMGNRMRLIIQSIELVKYPNKMPNLPVGGLMWKYQPNFKDGVAAWIHAGGAHHTVVSSVITKQEMIDLGNMWGVEVVVIDEKTEIINEIRRICVERLLKGELEPCITAILPLAEARKAHEMLDAGKIIGKMLLQP